MVELWTERVRFPVGVTIYINMEFIPRFSRGWLQTRPGATPYAPLRGTNMETYQWEVRFMCSAELSYDLTGEFS